MPLESPFATTATTATANATAAAGGGGTTSSSRPISPLPQPQPHPHHHYPSPQPLYQPIRLQNPQLTKPHDPSHPFLYPFSSSSGSARPFIPKGVRALSTDHVVTVANPTAGYSPHSLVYSHGVRAMASPHLDYLNHPLHVTRPPHLQYPPQHLGSAAPAAPIKSVGVPVSTHPKAAPRSAVSDSNGYKDTSTRERSRDDTFFVVRDRKVRMTEDASLYALCRSWLRNGINEESQPQQKDVMKALPKPLPASMVASYMSTMKEDEKDEDEQEENEKSVEHLSPQDLLKRHIKRAKRVRARLREERSQRIKRYRSRLSLLLPPPIEQFRNETAAGN